MELTFKMTIFLSEMYDHAHEMYREIEWSDGYVERLAIEGSQEDRDYWFKLSRNHRCTGIEEVFI